MKPLTVNAAITIGTAWVNLPIAPLMLAPPAAFVLLTGRTFGRNASGGHALLLGLFALGFVMAWAWWSLMVPRWRLWAWARVEDTEELRRRAVKAGLIWPEGHVFEKTEARSAATTRRLAELESKRPPRA